MDGDSRSILCSSKAAAVCLRRHTAGFVDSSGSASIIEIRHRSSSFCTALLSEQLLTG